MEWKTLAVLGLALIAGVVGAVLPEAQSIAALVAGACLGSIAPQPKTWGVKPDPAAPQAPASEAPTKVEKVNPEKSK